MKEGPAVLIWNRIMIGVDNSPASLAAVNYVAAVLGGSSNCRLQLVAVYVPPSHDNYADQTEWRETHLRQRQDMEDRLESSRQLLIEARIPEENISTQLLLATDGGVSNALVAYQRAHGFGTIVLGHRGLSKAEEFLYGSVSKAVVQQAEDCCVWVIG